MFCTPHLTCIIFQVRNKIATCKFVIVRSSAQQHERWYFKYFSHKKPADNQTKLKTKGHFPVWSSGVASHIYTMPPFVLLIGVCVCVGGGGRGGWGLGSF